MWREVGSGNKIRNPYHSRSDLPLLQVVRIQTFDWLKLRGCHAVNDAVNRIYVTCCKTSLPWVGRTRNKFCTNFVAKSRTSFQSLCNSLQQLFATCNNLICCRTILADSWWKPHKIAIQLILKQSFKTSHDKLHVFVACLTVP